jgi:NADPH:quinone reductase-like Zn-dependent oxidoreductase
MKAVVYYGYGGPEVLRHTELEPPTPADDHILVNVHAAAVNPLDWHVLRGTPYLMRIGSGFGKPKSIRLGVDFSGTVAAVGASVTAFKVGDAVFGAASGALAEYVAVPANGPVVRKPERLTFEQAAAVTVAGTTALQALRRNAPVQAGQRVIVYGASGGVGTFAVQLAKAFGAEVTGVQSSASLDLVRSIGADRVIDYTKEDFTRTDERYDIILDNVGNRSLSDVRRVLKPHGKYVLIGAGGPGDHTWVGPLGRILQMMVLTRVVNQDLGLLLAKTNQPDLQLLADLMQAGSVTPVIGRCFAFGDVAEAIRYLESGHPQGKVVVTIV